MHHVDFDICDFNNREVIALPGILYYKGADFFNYHQMLNLNLGKAMNLSALASFMILSECVKLGIPLTQAHRVMGGVVRAVVIECGLAPGSWKATASDGSASIYDELSHRTGSDKRAFVISMLGLEGRAIRRFLFSAGPTVESIDDVDIIFNENGNMSVQIIDARAIAKKIMRTHRRAFFAVEERAPARNA